MTRRVRLLLATALIAGVGMVAAPPSHAGEIKKAETRRQQLDRFAAETLEKLFRENEKARRLYERSTGYAVFDSAKFSILVSGGGGVGVAVDRASGEKTYMKMGTAGLGLGLGGQVYQLVFLFEDRETFDDFVTKGWKAGASANAVAGRTGANADASFTNGLAVYQLTEAGLMLQADIAGTKYWNYRSLNRR